MRPMSARWCCLVPTSESRAVTVCTPRPLTSGSPGHQLTHSTIHNLFVANPLQPDRGAQSQFEVNNASYALKGHTLHLISLTVNYPLLSRQHEQTDLYQIQIGQSHPRTPYFGVIYTLLQIFKSYKLCKNANFRSVMGRKYERNFCMANIMLHKKLCKKRNLSTYCLPFWPLANINIVLETPFSTFLHISQPHNS